MTLIERALNCLIKIQRHISSFIISIMLINHNHSSETMANAYMTGLNLPKRKRQQNHSDQHTQKSAMCPAPSDLLAFMKQSPAALSSCLTLTCAQSALTEQCSPTVSY